MPRVLDGGMCLVALLVPPPLVGQHGVPAPDGAHVTMGSLDPRFDRIVPEGTAVERIAEGFSWVEGPAWDRKGRRLLHRNHFPRSGVGNDRTRHALHRRRDGGQRR